MSFGIALVVGVLGSLLIAVITWALGLPRRASQRAVAALGWLWAAGVVGLTFGIGSGGGKAVNVALLDLGNSADRVDFLLNTVMFVPGGILLSVLRARLRSAILFGLLASLAIESAQYVTEYQRSPVQNHRMRFRLSVRQGDRRNCGTPQPTNRAGPVDRCRTGNWPGPSDHEGRSVGS
ncbi:VanZ family protein [Streptomyces anulatus]|uniref:VanZ family protein n=1 Tax=Streptomyces anulatus TaxID=1892 RepID=UPI0034306B37